MSNIELIALLNEKAQIESKLSTLTYGSIDIREKDNKRYIYVHYRENGLQITKYVGEYNADLINLILSNTEIAKQLKKRLKQIDKQLKDINYKSTTLDDKIALNIDFARKNLPDTIYKQAILEGVATTYSDTETIINGGKVSNMTANDIMKIINLKHAWEFVLNENVILSPTNFSLLCEINKIILQGFYYNAGKIRTVPVSIGGTNYKPELPFEPQIIDDINSIKIKQISYLDKAIELLLYVMKKQIFIDGNKRTAIIFANHLLISQGLGLIAVPSEKVEIFKSHLIAYYEGKDIETIKTFLKSECYKEL
ncbi:MAG: Fic family protein [Clostridia bacterium]|nr:Fic family protein [Clostridia bacterium]